MRIWIRIHLVLHRRLQLSPDLLELGLLPLADGGDGGDGARLCSTTTSLIHLWLLLLELLDKVQLRSSPPHHRRQLVVAVEGDAEEGGGEVLLLDGQLEAQPEENGRIVLLLEVLFVLLKDGQQTGDLRLRHRRSAKAENGLERGGVEHSEEIRSKGLIRKPETKLSSSNLLQL